jgi:alkylation response protein AidB-like acyl-CoA dehydrogenase
MIRDSTGWLSPKDGAMKRVRALRYTEPGFDRTVWHTMCEMGWLGLRLPEENGGAGLGMLEFCALVEELGKMLAPEPLVHAAAVAGLLPPQWQSPVLTGVQIVLPAWQEQLGAPAEMPATSMSDGRVTGQKAFVPMAAGADAFLVTTREGLALVKSKAPGVHLTLDRTQDGGHWGTLTLENAPAESVPGDHTDAREEAVLAIAAYLLGVMDRAFAITLEHLKTREQFGRPLASFQALQHRAVDLLLQISLARASVESAAKALDGGVSGPRRYAAVSRAKARASDAALLVTREGIQLHGGIGYTDECDIGLFLRKAMVLANCLGSAAFHRARNLDLTDGDAEQ